LDPDTGNLSITFNGSTFSSSFIDSGSNANYFVDSAIQQRARPDLLPVEHPVFVSGP